MKDSINDTIIPLWWALVQINVAGNAVTTALKLFE